ncbi:MAG: sarcosine oxidase subunit gamma family protein [Chakrabartia sp.]
MSDPLIRTEPVPTAPFVANGVTISLAPAMARYSLRAREAQVLETLLKTKVPDKIGATMGGIACLGPDEWLKRGPVDNVIPTGEGLAIAVTDVSERAVCFNVEGPRAAEVLMSGCPLDLDFFATGRASRTLYETVEIILIRESDDCFHVEVWRSFAPWLWNAITVAASH